MSLAPTFPPTPTLPAGRAEPDTNEAATQRYRARIDAAVWRRWGDELAVYEDSAARTHLLADGHAELFGLLAAKPELLTMSDIAREFEGGENGPGQPALSEAEMHSLQTLVHELVALGLVEAVPT